MALYVVVNLVSMVKAERERGRLGCSHWSLMFCGNPFGDEHAFGDPPRT